MRKVGIAVLAIVSVFAAGSAEAGQGFFGGRSEQDGSINVRRSTTSQFEPIRGQSVASRARPDFDPTPINIGSFQAFPAINTSAYYDSNIYSAPAANNDDVVFKIDPSLSVASNWGRHAVAFTGFTSANLYSVNDTENNVSGGAQLEGRYDISNQTWAGLTTGYQRGTEPRGNASAVGGAAEPTQFDILSGGVELYRGVGALKTKANYDINYRDYDAVALNPVGTASQSNRNRISNKIKGEVQYDVSENLKPFVRGAFDWTDYTANSLRSSHGYSADVGAKMDLGGTVTTEAFVGYTGRDYYNFANSGVNAVDFGANVLWNVSELTSVQGEVSRGINETSLGGAALPTASTSFISTGGSLTATHELRRDLIVEANASYTENDYQSSTREDDNYGLGAGARYFISRNFYSDLTYDYMTRDSNAAGADYSRHVALVRFGAQY